MKLRYQDVSGLLSVIGGNDLPAVTCEVYTKLFCYQIQYLTDYKCQHSKI